jgi:hypothetical protein
VKGGSINEDYYVQVRYRRGRRWVTVAVSEDRDVATRLAGDAYNGPRDSDDKAATQARTTSTANLLLEGGATAHGRAAADLGHRAKQTQ